MAERIAEPDLRVHDMSEFFRQEIGGLGVSLVMPVLVGTAEDYRAPEIRRRYGEWRFESVPDRRGNLIRQANSVLYSKGIVVCRKELGIDELTVFTRVAHRSLGQSYPFTELRSFVEPIVETRLNQDGQFLTDMMMSCLDLDIDR